MSRSIAMWFALSALAAMAAAPAAAQTPPRIVVQNQEARGAIVRAGVVFAPLDALLRPYGASARWDASTRSADVAGGRGARISVRAGDPRIHVNGEPSTLPAAPYVDGDALMVPAQALFQALGAWAKWEPAENTLHVAAQITRISFERSASGLRVAAEATGPVVLQVSTLPQPDRLIADFMHAVLRDAVREVTVADGGVRRARVAQFQTKPYVTRVVFDLEGPVEVSALPSAGFDRVFLVRPRGAPAAQLPAAQPAAAPITPAVSPAPTPASSTTATPTVPGGAPSAAPAPSATSAPSPFSGEAPAGAPAGPSATPPPFSASTPVGAPSPSSADTVAGPLDPEAPRPSSEPPRIADLVVQRVPGGVRIVVQGDQPLRGEARELPDPSRLVIDLPGVFVPVRQEFVLTGLVQAVRGAQFTADSSPVARIVLQWRFRLPYQVTAEDGGNRLIIFVQEQPVVARGAHVVAIDAGHGGRDPGAIGATGLAEKDVILDVSLRLRTFLAQRGVRTVMTRETDVFVELENRVPIAAQSGATVFVSVHANSSQRPVVRGSETYYLQANSQALATMIQEEMGRALGIPDRGIRTANFKVLRDASIPACLVELAYLSNVSDEELLRSPAFRQLAAESIGRGVLRFLATLPAPAP
jgi:N-acetylmuramoyl-L-alanine amidase